MEILLLSKFSVCHFRVGARTVLVWLLLNNRRQATPDNCALSPYINSRD